MKKSMVALAVAHLYPPDPQVSPTEVLAYGGGLFVPYYSTKRGNTALVRFRGSNGSELIFDFSNYIRDSR